MKRTLPDFPIHSVGIFSLMLLLSSMTFGYCPHPKIPVSTYSAMPADTTQSPWVLQRGDTLYWAIPPTATWEDIHGVREALKAKGAEMRINRLNYDPLQLYLTTLVFFMHLSTGQNGTGEVYKDDYTPIKGYTGFVGPRLLGMGFAPPEPLLTNMKESYQKALALRQENEIGHLEDQMEKEFLKKRKSLTYTPIPKRFMEGLNAESTLKKEGVGKSPDNTLLITDLNNEAEFYLNARPYSRNDLSRLKFDRIEKVNIGVDSGGKRYVMVYMRVGY